MPVLCAILAVLTIWDYPSRHLAHQRLRAEFVQAVRTGDTRKMEEASRAGTELLPDDATWAYNLACSLAYKADTEAALDQLEKAIDLGYRDADAIAADADFRRLSTKRRFKDLVEYAKTSRGRPVLTDPLVSVPATGLFGQSLAIGEQNLSWDFDGGCFLVNMALAPGAGAGGNFGDLYMNRDAGHSRLVVTNFLGVTEVRLDQDGRAHHADLDFPNMVFPYPVFGNCSRAYIDPVYWRSIPRALMTSEAWRMPLMERFYLSNQTWVFPANADFPPIGTNGDCFVSVSPYWLTTQGRSWSDQYYLRAALEASRSLESGAKREIVSRGLLAPTIQMLIRKSLKGVGDEDDYLTEKAHPTCLPPNGLDLPRLKSAAAALRADVLPPLAAVKVAMKPPEAPVQWPECLYATAHAAAFVLRAPDAKRTFILEAAGGDEFAFRQVHGDPAAVTIELVRPNIAKVEFVTDKLKTRTDIAVFARTAKSGWGAPSYFSFSTPDLDAPYQDPVLQPKIEVK